MSDHLTQTHIIEEITDTPHDTPPTHHGICVHIYNYTQQINEVSEFERNVYVIRER